MEIAPISGIRGLPVMKTPPEEPRLTTPLPVENSQGPGDDTYSGGGKKSADGQEKDEEESEQTVESGNGEEASEGEAGANVDYFA
jgi:hypothetical protein